MSHEDGVSGAGVRMAIENTIIQFLRCEFLEGFAPAPSKEIEAGDTSGMGLIPVD